MKLRISTTLVFETLMLLVVGVMLVAATRYPHGVMLFPFVVGVPTLILLFVLWLGTVCPEWKGLGRKGKSEGADAEKAFEDSDFTPWVPVLNTLGWIAAYYVLIFVSRFFRCDTRLADSLFLPEIEFEPGKIRPWGTRFQLCHHPDGASLWNRALARRHP